MTEPFNTVEDEPTAKLEKKEEKKALAFNQVKLSDGRIIEMRESTGADEMIVSGELGEIFTANGAGAVIFQSCLIAKTIISIDGKPITPLRGFIAYREFAGSFKSKDWNKVKNLYDKLNGGTEGND